MMQRISTAPGKLVIAGEYAVLNGAPAIATAVDRRVAVTVEPNDDDCHSVRAPGWVDHVGRFQASDDGVVWREGETGFDLITATWPHFKITGEQCVDIRIDSRALLHASGTKLGLGSSAAVTVALAGALVADGHSAIAADAHRQFQGGRGSGVDIACSTTGGVIEFEGGRTRSIEWPEGLAYTVLWSGQPASTSDKLSQLDGADSATSRTLYRAAQHVAEYWQGDDLSRLLSSLAHYVTVLRAFDIDHRLGIFDAGHRELMEIAESMNLLYKPCGAGGGDLGIVLYEADTDIAPLLARAKGVGFEPLDMSIDPEGWRLALEGPR
ncbi:MAG: hypothetical protein AAF351_02655 [Pseudomonadota bacterium]